MDGKKFKDPPIIVILLYEENFPRDRFSEKFGILSFLTKQRERCTEVFQENDFNVAAFSSRMQQYHVEQEPKKKECQLNIDYTKNSDPQQLWTTIIFFLTVMMILFVIVVMVLRNTKNSKKKK